MTNTFTKDMDDVKRMLRAVINGQSAMKSELLAKITALEKKVDKLDLKIDAVDQKLTTRIDKIGKSVAFLEDDAPTVKEIEDLTSRVDVLEHQFSTL